MLSSFSTIIILKIFCFLLDTKTSQYLTFSLDKPFFFFLSAHLVTFLLPWSSYQSSVSCQTTFNLFLRKTFFQCNDLNITLKLIFYLCPFLLMLKHFISLLTFFSFLPNIPINKYFIIVTNDTIFNFFNNQMHQYKRNEFRYNTIVTQHAVKYLICKN